MCVALQLELGEGDNDEATRLGDIRLALSNEPKVLLAHTQMGLVECSLRLRLALN